MKEQEALVADILTILDEELEIEQAIVWYEETNVIAGKKSAATRIAEILLGKSAEKKPVREFTEGQVVRIIGRKASHPFEIGTIVKIVCRDWGRWHEDWQAEGRDKYGNLYTWWIATEDAEPVAEILQSVKQ